MFEKNSKTRSLCLILTATLALWAYAPPAHATRITTAEVEDCLVNEMGFSCEKKVIVSVDVSYGIQANLEAIQVTTIQKDGEPVEVEETIEMELEKSIPTLIYPLKHLHTVAYFPYEQVIRTPHPLSGCTGCLDCSGVSNPTCGWTYQGSNKVQNSQGFCSIKNLFDLKYTNPLCSGWRGEKLIGTPATEDAPYATAHCLRLGELYYHGYEIGEHSEYYEIKAHLKKGDNELVFSLSPADPIWYINEPGADGWKLRAELAGQSEKYKGVPQLSNYILYIPASPDTHPFVQDYQHNMLLLPREELSKDGTEFDKVGISFYKFRKLAATASVSEAGDGIHNQLFHKHNSDLQKLILNSDAETEYLVHGKKKFKQSMEFKQGMPKFLQYRVPEINNSQVAITMDLDTLKVISTESLGIIKSATIEEFTSMSDDGTLVVEIQNYGDLKTDYVVTVTIPSMNIIHAIPAQAVILEPMEITTLKFDIHTAFNRESTENSVLVTMKSPTGRFYAEEVVTFTTTKHLSKYSWDLLLKNEDSEVTKPSDPNAPVITLNGPDTIILACNSGPYVEQGATAVDDVDGTVAVIIGGNTVDTTVSGIYTVRYFARDAVCNYSEKTRTVKVICPAALMEGDINGDRKVNVEDLSRLAANWLNGT